MLIEINVLILIDKAALFVIIIFMLIIS